MPTLVPLFPLPNVVLFPGVPLQLHVFEPRYRAMVTDALDGERQIGMMLLQPGWEGGYEGRPPIYPIGCTGVIVHSSKLDDGRYNILLHGLERVRVVQEDHARPYRRAEVEALPDLPPDAGDERAVRDLRRRLVTLIGAEPSPDLHVAESIGGRLALMPDADFVHTLAHVTDLEALEKQALLERPTLRLRAQGLVELLEMRRLFASMPATTHRLQ